MSKNVLTELRVADLTVHKIDYDVFILKNTDNGYVLMNTLELEKWTGDFFPDFYVEGRLFSKEMYKRHARKNYLHLLAIDPLQRPKGFEPSPPQYVPPPKAPRRSFFSRLCFSSD